MPSWNQRQLHQNPRSRRSRSQLRKLIQRKNEYFRKQFIDRMMDSNPTPPTAAPTRPESRHQDRDIFRYQMKYKGLLIRILQGLHDALTRLRTQHPGPAADPLPWWRPHRLDNGEWGSIYLGDTSVLPADLAGATIVVQS